LRDRKLVLIVAPISDAEPMTFTCGICGFVMNGVGQCASRPSGAWHGVTVRCKLEIAERARDFVETGEERDVASPAGDGDQVTDWLEGRGQ
jgi:hypothetical protein